MDFLADYYDLIIDKDFVTANNNQFGNYFTI